MFCCSAFAYFTVTTESRWEEKGKIDGNVYARSTGADADATPTNTNVNLGQGADLASSPSTRPENDEPGVMTQTPTVKETHHIRHASANDAYTLNNGSASTSLTATHVHTPAGALELDQEEGDSTDEEDETDSDSDYLSFEDSDDEATDAVSDEQKEKDREARERERQLVLEAAGLIVQQVPEAAAASGSGLPPLRPKARSVKRRPAPAAPSASRRDDVKGGSSSGSGRPRMGRVASMYKDLPPVPAVDDEAEAKHELTHEARLDDAFARYENFKNNLNQASLNRLSVISTDSSIGGHSGGSGGGGPSTALSPTSPTNTISSVSLSLSQSQGSTGKPSSTHTFLNFLRSKTPDLDQAHKDRKSISTLNISAPIMAGAQSTSSMQTPSSATNPSARPNSFGGSSIDPGSISRSNSPSFGMSWASLVNKSALEGIPDHERKRQEAIFELINTEVAYVRDLQLIVEVFYTSMLPLLSKKENTVVFANIEDLLLTNTGFVSALEERQKECRLYIDKIGDILLTHLPSMSVYMEWCVNQATAAKVLQSLRDSKPDLNSHLQTITKENVAVRSLDLSSYMLAPMQRLTRYPLLIKQILKYTEQGSEEHHAIASSLDMSEKLLDHINETIRYEEGFQVLKMLSKQLWVGSGLLNLTKDTKNMGPRRLLKQGMIMKAKSGRKLQMFLCNDVLVITDEAVKILYRMPIPLAHAQVQSSITRDETGFTLSQLYPRGGDTVALRAQTPRDCQQWMHEIGHAIKKARAAEERAARKASARV